VSTEQHSRTVLLVQ